MKYRMLAVLASLVLALTPLSSPRPAHAAVGLPFAPVALSVLGGVLVANVAHGLIRLGDTLNLEASQFIIFGTVSAGVGFLIGVILLDADEHRLEFQPLSASDVAALGLTAEEAAAYHAEREEMNAWASEAALAAAAELSRRPQDLRAALDASARQWEGAVESGLLSLQAFRAARKITEQATQRRQ